jgi:hypothetical protein
MPVHSMSDSSQPPNNEGHLHQSWVLYHADCLDGFGAAWAAWRALGEKAHYQPVRHGEAPPDIPSGCTIYMLDFCYPPERLIQLAARAERVIVLDHHETAQQAFENHFAGQPDISANLLVHFDLTRSGCALAWQHFHPHQPLPALLAHIEDRDLWRHQMPGTREINQALYLRLPLPFHAVETLSLAMLEQEGGVLCLQQRQSVQRLMHSRHAMRLCGFEGLAVNAPPQFASDLGEALARESGTFGLIYRFNGQRQRWECSLRSRGEFNVASLAKHFGGGGHPNAAGFTLDAAQSPCRGVVDLSHSQKAAECFPGDVLGVTQPELVNQEPLLNQLVALTVEHQHRFDPYRGAQKRAYLMAAERFGVTNERAKCIHADHRVWLSGLSDDALRKRLETLQTESGWVKS